jgi:hypothetical protein
VIQTIGALSVARVTAPKGLELAHARKYRGSRWVEYAEPNWTASVSDLVPLDPYFESKQWDVQRIQAPAAWDLTCGAASIVIAVIDTGVDYNHPDLASRIVPGYDFYNGDSDPWDDHGHGTAVAGIVGACTDNGIGVAGITWFPKVMPIKVASASGSAPYSAIANGITYATDHGARVVNISIAGSSSSSTLNNAVDYAYQRGCLVVAASGNNGIASVYYPAACANALAVGATDQNDLSYSYSNYGSALDVMAPGAGYTTLRGGGYGGFGGTSAASPHAAGVAALVVSANLSLSAGAVSSIVKDAADDLDLLGWDQFTGWGRVNAYKAVTGANSPTADTQAPSVSLTSPTNGATISGAARLTATAADNIGVVAVDFYADSSYIGRASSGYYLDWDSRSVPNGGHGLTAKAVDATGNVGASSPVSITVSNTTTTTQVFSGNVSTKSAKAHSWQTTVPVTGTATLSWTGTASLQLRLLNSAGTQIVAGSSPTSPITLNLGALPAGSYKFEIKAITGKTRYNLTVTTTNA